MYRQVTDTAVTVLPIDLTSGDDVSQMLYSHIGRLLKQRRNELMVCLIEYLFYANPSLFHCLL
jgi:hypothetical protein